MIARLRPAASYLYRSGMAPLGRRALERAVNAGLPMMLVPPLRYLFTGVLGERAREIRDRVEQRRLEIAARRGHFGHAHVSTPHGPARWLVERSAASGGPTVTPRWLAHTPAVPERWGLFLHLLADAVPRAPMLELGTSVGISAAYLASGRGCDRLLTIEGSPPISRLAQASLTEMGLDATVMNASFDEGLDQVFWSLDREGPSLGLAYLDGHHDEVATLHYVERIVPRLRRGAVIVLDDIYLYDEMWRAWTVLAHRPGVSAAVNVGRFGLLVRGEAGSRAAQHDLSRYTGWWRVGGSRRVTPLPGLGTSA